ncbi:TIM barrel protein [Citrobacter sp. MNAZ 1397]|uniref:sugar phosphate isomerase/epimerase family protein n=1 Tax=Citrobacter sp. MNAZ 1397 TaxID=2911205 RepID=UPI0020264ED7|nr:TIM barrel protein [Citrobacter sp. MNAZ 1397]MCL9670158.1 sugar phosphate isomerase/epimerase [Citrobacter sp. MNAZ 1397]
MRISISNLAWDVREDVDVLSLLKEFQVDAIDIAPGKYFPEPAKATTADILTVKTWWKEQGVDIIGMQSLLFGTTGLNVFGSQAVQEKLLEHLADICRIGSVLGATRLVFGSPKNRDCSGLSAAETERVAHTFFRRLGNIAADQGVIVCLEPNPAVYGANFMTTSSETCDVVTAIAHPNIKMQLDTGAVIINRESIEAVVAQAKDVIGHVHISEAQLATVGDTFPGHAALAEVLKTQLATFPATIEMLATKEESHLVSIRRALSYVTSLYR